MANHYSRNCTKCGAGIRMAEMANGQWLPFEVNGDGHHRCSQATRSVGPILAALSNGHSNNAAGVHHIAEEPLVAPLGSLLLALIVIVLLIAASGRGLGLW